MLINTMKYHDCYNDHSVDRVFVFKNLADRRFSRYTETTSIRGLVYLVHFAAGNCL